MFDRGNNSKVIGVALALLIVAAGILWWLSPKYEATVIDETAGSGERDRVVRILLVGESFTYTAHLPSRLAEFANEQDPALRLLISYVSFPDYTLRDHWERGSGLEWIKKEPWDYLVLQENPDQLLRNPDVTRRAIFLFDDEVKRVNPEAKTILLMPWSGIKHENQHKICQLTRDVGRQAGVFVAPIGDALELLYESHRGLKIETKEGLGPSGAYLAVATLYCALFQEKPRVLAISNWLTPSPVSEEEAKALVQMAIEVVEEDGIKLKEATVESMGASDGEPLVPGASNSRDDGAD